MESGVSALGVSGGTIPPHSTGIGTTKGGMAVRRFHIAMLALGLVGVLGVTIAQVAAQPGSSPYGTRKGADKGVVPTEFATPATTSKEKPAPSSPAPGIVVPPDRACSSFREATYLTVSRGRLSNKVAIAVATGAGAFISSRWPASGTTAPTAPGFPPLVKRR